MDLIYSYSLCGEIFRRKTCNLSNRHIPYSLFNSISSTTNIIIAELINLYYYLSVTMIHGYSQVFIILYSHLLKLILNQF